jgi:hypothetical protein
MSSPSLFAGALPGAAPASGRLPFMGSLFRPAGETSAAPWGPLGV